MIPSLETRSLSQGPRNNDSSVILNYSRTDFLKQTMPLSQWFFFFSYSNCFRGQEESRRETEGGSSVVLLSAGDWEPDASGPILILSQTYCVAAKNLHNQ